MDTQVQVVVVIGAGGIGQAIARRQGSGKTVLLADFNQGTLASAAKALEASGHNVTTRPVDVSSRESVHGLAQAAVALGDVVQVVDTVGLSPVSVSGGAPGRRSGRGGPGARGVRPDRRSWRSSFW